MNTDKSDLRNPSGNRVVEKMIIPEYRPVNRVVCEKSLEFLFADKANIFSLALAMVIIFNEARDKKNKTWLYQYMVDRTLA